MSKKTHYSKRLKEENKQLLSDLYAILDGDTTLATIYLMKRKIKHDMEKTLWQGRNEPI